MSSTIIFVFEMFILKPLRLLSSHSSCSIIYSSCFGAQEDILCETEMVKIFSVYFQAFVLPVQFSEDTFECE